MEKTQLKALLNGLIAAVDTLYLEDHAEEDHQEQATTLKDIDEQVGEEYTTLLKEDHDFLRLQHNRLEIALRNLIEDAKHMVEEHARWAYRDGLDKPVEKLALQVTRSERILEEIGDEFEQRRNEE